MPAELKDPDLTAAIAGEEAEMAEVEVSKQLYTRSPVTLRQSRAEPSRNILDAALN